MDKRGFNIAESSLSKMLHADVMYCIKKSIKNGDGTPRGAGVFTLSAPFPCLSVGGGDENAFLEVLVEPDLVFSFGPVV